MRKFVKLFEPTRIGSMELKNRIKAAPIGLGASNGSITDRMIAFWEARARGGVGFISFAVMAMPGALWGGKGVLKLMEDSQIPDVKRVVQAIQKYGAKIALSISHPGGRVAELYPEQVSVAPSAIRNPFTGVMTKELSKEEIKKLVQLWVTGARRVKGAGADAVYIQGCHGYLVHQFLSKRTNKRADEYGGTVVKRARFACEIIESVRKEVGPDFPILIRMHGEDHLEGGITVGEAIEQARLFIEAGVDGIDISSGPRESYHWQFITLYQESGALVGDAALIKKAVKVPVTVVGKIDPFLAERILEDGSVDVVAFLRSLIADPEWPNKVKDGRFEDIRPCIYCNKCQYRVVLGSKQICSVNVAAGAELEYQLEPASKKKKVIVVGGGLAGLETARTLAERGHKVSLYEKGNTIGGQWNILSAYRPEVANLVKYLSREVKKAGVDVFLNQEVSPELIAEKKPDAVVVATGANPIILDVPGVHGRNVFLATDVLMGKVNVGKEVVIIGGRLVGLDTAIFLTEQGKKVSVVEQFKIAWGVGEIEKLALKEKLINLGVYLYPNSVLESITENGVMVINDGEFMFLKADTVVLAVGSKAESTMVERIRAFVNEVYSVGDCVEPRSALEAIHEGSTVGRKI